ncbi:Leu/Phe/Val dehydrogenase [Garciella nitratireducens]|uniref:Leucine dehydrogenase n=1 Tax=Garciella nitratireducens DSM 15102 TaxID=1121911 RepID=A0A1T4MUG2_9FIRM|nr:Glu/Leu/Phe/Val dehydrogenase [Garciella nitratireducens]RBP44940.1 leucine dehydrogenase [Garciella nitratireducens]SJZ70699.1 leucine dehydrogenase [Garciella nitratireducens DSM 15102]
MKIFDYMEKYNYEQLVFCHDATSGLKAIIGIHDTTLGPALGGTRIWNYETEEDAILDVLRLSRGMTYKNSVAGLNLGGGKAVIIGDPDKIKSEELFRAYGRYVESLGGRYITAEDMNTTTKDMDIIHEETEHVVGLEGKSGNPSPVTAYGVFRGLLAAVEEAFGTKDLKDKVVAVQGLGAVGYCLCKHLHEAGAKLIVTDIKKEYINKVVQDFGAKAVAPDKIYGVECDIFAPCAMGAIINDFTIEQLKCKVVAGSANNQLAEEKHGDMLEEKGIIYAPDYVVNGAGVMNVYEELQGYNEQRAMARASGVYEAIKKVIEIAKRDGIPTYKAADRMAEERIQKIGELQKIRFFNK